MDLHLSETVAIAFYATLAVVVYGIAIACYFRSKR